MNLNLAYPGRYICFNMLALENLSIACSVYFCLREQGLANIIEFLSNDRLSCVALGPWYCSAVVCESGSKYKMKFLWEVELNLLRS